ncbi:MAG TPA: ABC transporter ATP-binding protein, partial [Acidimicrobiales bacterium]|nr:ABC transporter ATP-binding protein [Acidimicrobiales bacterium]
MEIERLSYTYPVWADRPAPALQDVGLVLDAGITVLTGDSGAGKSTLLRVLNGLVPHFHGGRISGRASVLGMDVISTPTRELARHVGFVFQEPENGFVRSTVELEVAFGPENLGLTPKAIRRQVGSAMERVGISDLAKRRLRTLSGGERQRVALAGVLAAEPAVLALDEPTSQLDPAGAARLAQIVAEM